MIRCSDNSIYTGITTDIERRFLEHKTKSSKCAKYTYNHDVVSLECYFTSNSRSLACKLEYYIKKLTKEEKELLIKDKNSFPLLLGEKVIVDSYLRN